MNVGLFYRGWGDPAVAAFLYPLTNGAVELLDGFGDETRHHWPESFKITDGDHCFHFSRNRDELNYCDVRLALGSADRVAKEDLDVANEFDWFVLAKTDGEAGSNIPHEEFLNRYPNMILISSHLVPGLENHPRMIVDRAINLFYFYNVFGFYWLNYYPTKEKQNLIGVYNRYSTYKSYRTKLLDLMTEYSGQPYHCFGTQKNWYTELTGKVFDKWFWQQMHMTSYTDYNTCAVNVVFESATGSIREDLVNEKTLKAIIFQKAKIFFIHFGTYQQLDWLHSKGFWFLNSEFYNPDTIGYPHHFPAAYGLHDPKSRPLVHSVCDTFKFLKKLKDELGTDTAVYNFLLEKYGHKLEQTSNAFERLLTECEYKDRLWNMITIKKAEQ